MAFLSVNPLRTGHALVVPRDEVDHWLDASPELNGHLVEVAHHVGRAQMAELAPTRIGLMIAGLEVPHLHVHVVPMDGVRDLDFANAASHVDPGELAATAAALRARLRAHGHDDVPAD